MIITNLFSIFDPSLRVIKRGWLITLIPIIIIPRILWRKSINLRLINKTLNIYSKEVKYVINNPKKGIFNIMTSMFIGLSLYNFIALFPFIYSTTSHASTNLPIAFSIWVGCILYGLFKSLKNFLCHLIPNGTPIALIRFIVLVEILRNLIRPLALTFRLTANIIAGHLLISLIGGRIITLPIPAFIRIRIIQSLLVIIEIGVSVIQAYVFSTLILLYVSER